MKSKKKSEEIRDMIKEYCRILADKINLSETFIKLRDFVQVIDHTGSETPRIVYMYQSALYLYNLERTDNPFSFYIIDTPNQQGQDIDNLKSIFKSLESIMSDDGQVIVGTERETGRLIVEEEQNSSRRAAYGKYLIPELSRYLTERMGRGYSVTNLKQMRKFYQVYADDQIGQMLSDQLQNLPTVSTGSKFY